MRIVLIGQAGFAEKVLERLIGRGEEVVGLFCPPDSPGRLNPLREFAQKGGIPVHQPKRMREAGAMQAYRTLNPELNILAFVTEIIPAEILQFPKYGSIQYHPSLLPKHRGKSAINWAVIQGDAKTGLSIFWVDEGIDTGPILLQKEVAIDPDDTTGSLYFDKLFPLGVDALMEAVDMIKAGSALRIPQDDSQATYEPPCDEQFARIDWERPLVEVYNLIRGCDPQPGAHTNFKGRKLQIYKTRALLGYEMPPGVRLGEVMEIQADGILVSARGGALLIQRVRPEGGEKVPALDFARGEGLSKGDTL